MRAGRIISRCVMVAIIVSLADLAFTPWALRDELRAVAHDAPETTSFMRLAAANGHPVREYRWVALSAVAPVAACAVVLAEDEEYFTKGTFSWRAQRALLQRMLRGDFSRGGSGLPQQLARNLFLSPDRTPRRKAREYLLAYELSHAMPKLRLLELYLNVVEWGDGIWGIEAASQHYFGVSAADLTPAQAVVLVSFLPAPRRELRYALGPLAARRQEAITRKLWLARLLNDREYLATVERVREWRTVARQGGAPGLAWTQAALIMGPERTTFAASPATPNALPLTRLCDARRRGS